MAATLTYTNEDKGYRYEDGQYKMTGRRITNESGVFRNQTGGTLYKSNGVIAQEIIYDVYNGEMDNLRVNFINPSEAATAITQINACFAALNAENE